VAAGPEPEQRYDALLWVYGLAVETVTRARVLDDRCKGEGGVELANYGDTMSDWITTLSPAASSTPAKPGAVVSSVR
jgi:hypothetical protein